MHFSDICKTCPESFVDAKPSVKANFHAPEVRGGSAQKKFRRLARCEGTNADTSWMRAVTNGQQPDRQSPFERSDGIGEVN